MEDNKQNVFHILINERSGTVQNIGKEALEGMITSSGLRFETLAFVTPDKFKETLKEYKNASHPVLIGGGDGTIKSAVEILAECDAPFGILPLGTMNLFARDLGIPCEIEKTLEAYNNHTDIVNVDVGMVNDLPFLCCAAIGTIPESAEFREKNREQNDAILMPRLTFFVLNQLDRVKQRVVKISFDGRQKRLRTAALVISNNQYFPQSVTDANNFIRHSLTDGKLGIYSATPISVWDRVRLILSLKFGNWRSAPMIKEWCASTVSLKTNKHEELVSLDGETQTLKTPLNFWVEKKAQPVIVPKTAEKETL